MKALPPSASAEIYLDPEVAQAHRARRDRRHNVVVIPALRLIGFLLIAALLLIHNDVMLGAVDWPRSTAFVVASIMYSIVSWLLLARFYRPFARVDLGFVFLLADNVVWAFAVYVSGGEQSWLFLTLIAHVLDQGATTVRRVLVFANVAVLVYIATLVWIDVIDALPVAWGVGLAKASVLYAFGVYGALTAAPAESLRRRSIAAIRVARTALVDLAAQRRQLEENSAQLVEAKQRAEKANLAKTEFLSRVSHEMRTPMNAILGFAQVLQQEQLTPQQRNNVRHILDAGEILLAMIDDVLELEGIEQNRVALELAVIPVGDVISEVVRLAGSLAATHHVALQVSAPEEYLVHADRRRLKQVLVNLVSNAIKYNRANGRVTLRSESMGERVRVSVMDTGIGIAADRLTDLFTPFDRLGAESTTIEGTGLGLVVSRALVLAMNGAIGLHSELGVGSTFWIELPIVSETARYESGGTARAAGKRPPRVLCVEDNASNARLIEILLVRQRGMQVTFADTGTRALELAFADPPDLVLLDLNLPEISGLDVLRALRSDARTRTAHIIVVSADAMPEHVAAVRAAGADDYITKPYYINDLITAVNRLLERRPG